jgi:hypothetical protein
MIIPTDLDPRTAARQLLSCLALDARRHRQLISDGRSAEAAALASEMRQSEALLEGYRSQCEPPSPQGALVVYASDPNRPPRRRYSA